jgi:hypothetical protein
VRKVAIIRCLGRNTIRQCAATLGLAREKVGLRSARPVAPSGPCPFAVERLYAAAEQTVGRTTPVCAPRHRSSLRTLFVI